MSTCIRRPLTTQSKSVAPKDCAIWGMDFTYLHIFPIFLFFLYKKAHYEDVEDGETQVKYLWEALTAFSVEDRSRFLRFVTGRRRLPAPLYICQGKGYV